MSQNSSKKHHSFKLFTINSKGETCAKMTYAGEEHSSQSSIHDVQNPVTDDDAEDAEEDQDN